MVVVNFAQDTVTVDLTSLDNVPHESSVYLISTTYAKSFPTK